MLAVLSLISAFTAKGNFGCVEGQVLYVPKVEAAARTTSSPLNVPGIKLSLISETGETTTATTNESGSFHFPHPKFGTYKLEFNGPGGRHFSTRLSVSPRNPTWAMSLRICELTVGDKPSLKLEIRPIPNPGLRRKLLSMVAEDQAVRHRWIAADATKPHPEMMAEMEALNSKHITNLRAWVQKLGWLGPNLVGEDGANAAFILIQHAAPKTQIAWYPLVELAFKRHLFRPEDFAMFTDRVLLAKGKKQRYGTVAMSLEKWKDGVPILEPIENPESIDHLRASVGLMPLAEYIEMLKKMYQSPRKSLELPKS